MRIAFEKSYTLLWIMYLSGVNSACIAMVERTDTALEALGGDESYSRPNGGVENTYAPVNRDEDPNMFTIPRILNNNDKFEVVGRLKANPQNFTLSITSGRTENVPCIINVNLSASITFEIVINGTRANVGPEQNIATNLYFTADSRTFKFEFLYSNGELKVMVENSYLHSFPLEHDIDNLKYIQLSGDVEKVSSLSFHFA